MDINKDGFEISPYEFCEVNEIKSLERTVILCSVLGDCEMSGADPDYFLSLLKTGLDALQLLIESAEDQKLNTENGDVTAQRHYTQHKIQHMEFAQKNGLSWFAANVTKYVVRYRNKNGKEDLLKAKFYLEKLMEHKETGNITLPSGR